MDVVGTVELDRVEVWNGIEIYTDLIIDGMVLSVFYSVYIV